MTRSNISLKAITSTAIAERVILRDLYDIKNTGIDREELSSRKMICPSCELKSYQFANEESERQTILRVERSSFILRRQT